MTDSSLPPGPRAPSLQQLYAWTYRPTELLERCHARYGDMFTLRLPAFPPMVVVARPDDVKQVFSADSDAFAAGAANSMLKATLGEHSLLLLDGARHDLERKLILPAFTGERLASYGEIMRAAAREVFCNDALNAWGTPRELFSLHGPMKQITMAVIMRAMFGQSPGDGLSEVPRLLDACLKVANSPAFVTLVDASGEIRGRAWQERTRWSPWSRFRQQRARLDAVLLAEIARRRAVAAERTDVMSLLMTMHDEAGRALDDAAIRDHMLSLLVAAHRTTAGALTWTMYWLLREPVVHRRVREELAGGSSDYLSLAIKEALRLSPPLAVVLRRVMSPQQVGSYLLPASVLVAPSSYLVHRRADCWDEPARFQPERFRTRINPYVYFPFGGGTRRCIGMAFALYEMNIVLSELLSAVSLELKPGYRPRTVRKGITFVISDGLPVRRLPHTAATVVAPSREAATPAVGAPAD